MGNNYQPVKPEHQSGRNIMRKAGDVEGDLHWIKDTFRSEGGGVQIRYLGCGIQEKTRGITRTKMKSTYNTKHVTCPGCLQAIAAADNADRGSE